MSKQTEIKPGELWEHRSYEYVIRIDEPAQSGAEKGLIRGIVVAQPDRSAKMGYCVRCSPEIFQSQYRRIFPVHETPPTSKGIDYSDVLEYAESLPTPSLVTLGHDVMGIMEKRQQLRKAYGA